MISLTSCSICSGGDDFHPVIILQLICKILQCFVDVRHNKNFLGIEFYYKTIPRHKIKLPRAGYNQTNNYISLLCALLEKPPLVTETLNTFSMIRFNTLLPLVLLVLGVSSCQKADIDVVEHEPMTVSLNLAGDFSVDVTQDPLTRAASPDDAHALNVYYDNEGDGSGNDI